MTDLWGSSEFFKGVEFTLGGSVTNGSTLYCVLSYSAKKTAKVIILHQVGRLGA